MRDGGLCSGMQRTAAKGNGQEQKKLFHNYSSIFV
jgi:hypothetical protein